jgi:hypothetical protein
MSNGKIANGSIPGQVNSAPAGTPAGEAMIGVPNLAFSVADGAEGVSVVDLQNAYLVGMEARLTREVKGLIGTLSQFGSRAQLISEELPVGAEFSKRVTLLLALLSLQLANALGQGLDKPIFFDDGALYLKQLGLGLDDFIREVDLDGRRFLCVALTDQGTAKGFDVGQDAGDGKGF